MPTATWCVRVSLLSSLLLVSACKKQDEAPSPAAKPEAAAQAEAPRPKSQKVGLVTDVGGRGDQSFNDSALRGLELWGAGKKVVGGQYQDASEDELKASLPQDLAGRAVRPVGITPVVLQSKVPQDYEPNLQTLVDEGAALTVGVGFMLESAVETIAKANPQARFLLIDSPLVGADGKPYGLPNVRTVVFREEQGSFLVGALAGLVSQTGKVGFVGGMEVPLIKRFEAGFRAGVAATRPEASVLVNYTGSFDNVATGKQVGQDLVSKGADVVFHAAGADGLGVIKAVEEAHKAGKRVYAIGVDSDQGHVAPEVMLTSMVKRVDLAVYDAVRDLAQGRFSAGDVALGLKEGGVGYAPVRLDFPLKAEALQKVEALRARVASGELRVPAHPSELTAGPGPTP